MFCVGGDPGAGEPKKCSDTNAERLVDFQPSMASLPMVWRLIVCGLALSSTVAAQTAIRHPSPFSELARAARDSDANIHWFKLELPVIGHSLWMSAQIGPMPTYELLRWPTYDWQMPLLTRGPLSLSAFNRVKPAIELDCTKGNCTPMLEKTLGMEMRLNLGGRGVMPDNFLFMRRESVSDQIRTYQRMKFGVGGLLDL